MVGDVVGVVGAIASMVVAVADAGEEVIDADWICTSTMVVDIWERNKELIRKRTDIGEHFTWEVIQSIVFIFYH